MQGSEQARMPADPLDTDDDDEQIARSHIPSAPCAVDHDVHLSALTPWRPEVAAPAWKRWGLLAADVIGAVLVAASASIHLHLWASSFYRHLPTIGPLFLLQAVSGYLIAIAILVLRRLGPVVIGAGFCAATAGGLLISVNGGLFGFQDSLTAPFAGLSLVVEAAGFAVLVGAAGLRIAGRSRRSHAAERSEPGLAQR